MIIAFARIHTYIHKPNVEEGETGKKAIILRPYFSRFEGHLCQRLHGGYFFCGLMQRGDLFASCPYGIAQMQASREDTVQGGWLAGWLGGG